MRLSLTRIKQLQVLLKRYHGLELDDEQAQQAGLAIMRFTIAKQARLYELNQINEDHKDESRPENG